MARFPIPSSLSVRVAWCRHLFCRVGVVTGKINKRDRSISLPRLVGDNAYERPFPILEARQESGPIIYIKQLLVVRRNKDDQINSISVGCFDYRKELAVTGIVQR